MKRKIMSLLLVSCLVLALFPIHAGAAAPVNVTINGVPVQFNDSTGYPFIDSNGRTQVPLRAAMEAMGADVGWNNYDRAASVVRGGNCVIVPIGEYSVYLNGNRISTDTSAQIIGGRTYLPIRVVAESLGGEVDWIGKSSTVAIQIGTKDTVYWNMESILGQPMWKVYYLFGYNCTEGWCEPLDAPSLVYEKAGISFNMEMDDVFTNYYDEESYHNPQNIVSSVTTKHYPIMATPKGIVSGQMSVADLSSVRIDEPDLIYEDGFNAAFGPCYWALTGWGDPDDGYMTIHIWDGETYPGTYTKSSYAILWKN